MGHRETLAFLITIIGLFSLACWVTMIVNDTPSFKGDWSVEITQVKTTDTNGNLKTIFAKGEHVCFNVMVRNIAFTSREATITIVVYDECGVLVGRSKLQKWLIHSGTTLIFIVDLQIPEWAHTGVATTYAKAYTDSPTQEGTPIYPVKSVCFLITKG